MVNYVLDINFLFLISLFKNVHITYFVSTSIFFTYFAFLCKADANMQQIQIVLKYSKKSIYLNFFKTKQYSWVL